MKQRRTQEDRYNIDRERCHAALTCDDDLDSGMRKSQLVTSRRGRDGRLESQTAVLSMAGRCWLCCLAVFGPTPWSTPWSTSWSTSWSWPWSWPRMKADQQGRRQWWIAVPARGPRQCRRAANHVLCLTGGQESLRARAGTRRAERAGLLVRRPREIVDHALQPFRSFEEEKERVAFQRRPDPCGAHRCQPIVALRRP